LVQCQGKRSGPEVGIHGCVDGVASEDDDVLGEPDIETGGDDGVGWMGQVICIYPYVPLNTPLCLIHSVSSHQVLVK